MSEKNTHQENSVGSPRGDYLVDAIRSERIAAIYRRFCTEHIDDAAGETDCDTLDLLRRITQATGELLELDNGLDLMNEEASQYQYGPLIPILRSHDATTMVSASDWTTWVSRAKSGAAIDTPIKSLCNDILQNCPKGAEDLSLRDLLDDPRSENLSSRFIRHVPMQLVVMCTAWAAYKNKYPEKTFECYISKLDRVKEEVKEGLAIPERRGDGNLPSQWTTWTLMVSLRGDLDRKVGEVAIEIKDKWPSNRLNETLRDYLVENYNELSKRENIGRKKIRTVIRCYARAAIFGRPNSAGINLKPLDILKSLNLPKSYQKCIRMRYGKRQLQTLDAVGKEMGLTRERVRQMEQKAAKIAKSAGKHLEARKWLAENALRAWQSMSRDGGVTVDPTASGNGFHANLPGDVQLGLLLGDMLPDELMDLIGDKVDDWWVAREIKPQA